MRDHSVCVAVLLLSLINAVKEETNKGVGEEVVAEQWGQTGLRLQKYWHRFFPLIHPEKRHQGICQILRRKQKSNIWVFFSASAFMMLSSRTSCIWMLPAKKCAQTKAEVMQLLASLLPLLF